MSFELGVDANRGKAPLAVATRRIMCSPKKRIDIAARPMAVEGRSAAHRLGLATRGLVAVHLVVFVALFVLPHQVRAQTDGICGRTATVRTAILAKIDGINDCGLVTSNHLAAITGVLSLNDQSIIALAAGDFDGLTALVTLDLYNNSLTALPADVFDGLTALNRLDLYNNSLTALPADVFDGLTALNRLDLYNNSLTALPADVFDGLTALNRLDLDNNSLIELPADVFSGVPSLWALFLNDNELTTLPDDVFEPLTSLTDRLFLENNPGAPFAPSAVALPDDGTVPSAGGTVMLDGSDSGGAWGAYVTYSWALTHPANGVTVVFDDPASAAPTVTIPPLLANTELTFTLTVTGRAGSFAGGVIPGTDTASVTGDATTANAPATGAPKISGTAKVSQTLTASTTGIADADGLTSPTYTYQWIRVNGDGMSNPADIPYATSSTYTLVTADLGKKIRVQVNFTDDDNHDEELTSATYPASGTVAAAPTPNLTVGSPSVTNNNPEPGEVFTLSATVTNTGDKDAPATTLWFYQSTDTTITTSDPSPGTEPVGALAAGATSPESKDVTAPATAGTYYYGACVDPVPNETNTTNNCSQSVRVRVSARPDLTVDLPSVNDLTPETGGVLLLATTVTNRGSADADATTLRFYQPTDATITTSDTEVGTDPVVPLRPLASSVNALFFTAPATAGTYYYGACVDPVPNETNTTNNCSQSVQVTVMAAPNLTVGSPSVTDSTPQPGGAFTLSVTVRNDGSADADATTLRFYQSTDATITTADTEVDTEPVGALAAGATSPESKDLTAPLTPATYYYGACVDPVPNERTTANNCSMAVTVSTMPPSPPPPPPPSPPPPPPPPPGPRKTVPDAPTNLLADGGNEQVALSWEAPENDGGFAITDYEVRINGRGSWISIDSTRTAHTVSGLTNGTAYVFQVRAVNAAGSSPYSNRAEATPGVGALDFAHFANGAGIISDLVFVNVATHPIRPVLYFYGQEGHLIDPESMVDLTEDLEVTEDGGLSIQMEMEPLGELTISTHGRGEVVRIGAGGRRRPHWRGPAL